MNKRFTITAARRRTRFRRTVDWDEELRSLPSIEEGIRRMNSGPSFLDLFTQEQVKELFSGALDPDL
jgi:hypothetical protein